MPLSETQLKNKVIQFIKRQYPGAWVYKAADRWTAGIPDLLLCIEGKFYAIELKVGRRDPEKIQKYVIKKIRSAGGRACVCRSVDEVREFLKGGGELMLDERELIVQFKQAKERRDQLKEDLKNVQEEYDRAEYALIEFLESKSAISTAKYESLGYAQIQRPRIYASCRQEDMDKLFSFLKEKQREDLVKTTVMPQSLSNFTKECIEGGVEVPEFIKYYLKSSIRLYA